MSLRKKKSLPLIWTFHFLLLSSISHSRYFCLNSSGSINWKLIMIIDYIILTFSSYKDCSCLNLCMVLFSINLFLIQCFLPSNFKWWRTSISWINNVPTRDCTSFCGVGWLVADNFLLVVMRFMSLSSFMSQFLMSALPPKDEARYGFSRAEVTKELVMVIGEFYDGVSNIILFVFIVLRLYDVI